MINAGMDDYISKPIDIGELKELIEKWIKYYKMEENIKTINLGFVNVFLVKLKEGFILIDTGIPNKSAMHQITNIAMTETISAQLVVP